MSITELTADEPSPAYIVTDNQAATQVNSGSFSPPAGSMVTVQWCWCMGNTGDSVTSNTVTDSNSVSYTAGVTEGTSSTGCVAGIFYHYYTAAPGSITLTLTATDTGGSGQPETAALVQVWSGVASSQTGAATSATQSVAGSTTLTHSITTTTTGSLVLVAATQINYNETAAYTGNANTSIYDQDQPALVIGESIAGHATNLTGTPGAITLGYTDNSGAGNPWSLAMLEILPAAGGAVAFPGAAIYMPSLAWRAKWDPERKPALTPFIPYVHSDVDNSSAADTNGAFTIIPAVQETSGPEADAGEAVAASLSSADTSGPEADAGEAITASLSDTDTSGPEADGGETLAFLVAQPENAARVSRTWRARWQPHNKPAFPVYAPPFLGAFPTDPDFSQPANDNGEFITASLSDTETSHGTDGGEIAALLVISSDTSGAEADAGEAVTATVPSAETSTGTEASLYHSHTGIGTTAVVSETSTGTDAGTVVASVSDTDTSGAEADGGEAIAASLSDTEVSGPEADASEHAVTAGYSLPGAIVVTGTGTNFTVHVPPPVVNGDFLLITAVGEVASNGTWLVPSGWTQITDGPLASSSLHQFMACWRVANSEPSSYTVQATEQTSPVIYMYSARGTATGGTIVLGHALRTSLSYQTSLPAPAYTPVRQDSLFIYGFGGVNSAGSGGGGLTPYTPVYNLAGAAGTDVTNTSGGADYLLQGCATTTVPGPATITTGVDEAGFLVEVLNGKVRIDSDASGPEADAGEAIAATLSDTETSHGSDAGEFIAVISMVPDATAHVSLAWHVRFDHTERPALTPFLAPPAGIPSDSENSVAVDAGAVLGAITADACHGEDAGFAFIVDTDGSQPVSDGGEQLAFFQPETCGGKDIELSRWPSDTDANQQPGADNGYWTGTLTTVTETGHGNDNTEVFLFSDTDTSGPEAEALVLDVYAYQPPFRFTGGYFQLVLEVPEAPPVVVWHGPRVDKVALEIAKALSLGAPVGTVVTDPEFCRCEEQETPLAGVSMHIYPALDVTVEVS